jgi:hypothetical protein
MRVNSNSREIVMEALNVQPGITKEEIISLIGGDLQGNVAMSVGETLSNLIADGLVIERNGRYWLKEHESKQTSTNRSVSRVVSYEAAHPVKLAAYYENRPLRKVAVYTAPAIYEDVVAIRVSVQGAGMIEYPAFPGGTRICIGDIPRWSYDQIVLRSIEKIQIVRAGGQTQDIDVPHGDNVTIATEDGQ